MVNSRGIHSEVISKIMIREIKYAEDEERFYSANAIKTIIKELQEYAYCRKCGQEFDLLKGKCTDPNCSGYDESKCI